MSVIETMRALRDSGWLVVLKAMPDGHFHVIQGARSEYDAPCDDMPVGEGKWSCEAMWMGKAPMADMWGLGETGREALRKVYFECVEMMRQRGLPLPAGVEQEGP